MGKQVAVQKNQSIKSVTLLKEGVQVDYLRFNNKVFASLGCLQGLESDRMDMFMEECLLFCTDAMESRTVDASFFEVLYLTYSLYRELQKPCTESDTGKE